MCTVDLGGALWRFGAVLSSGCAWSLTDMTHLASRIELFSILARPASLVSLSSSYLLERVGSHRRINASNLDEL
jgi:hypothetical protein